MIKHHASKYESCRAALSIIKSTPGRFALLYTDDAMADSLRGIDTAIYVKVQSRAEKNLVAERLKGAYTVLVLD